MLTGESFNALLKTLEEPPAHVVFILATTEVHKLPATIISRTQRFNFRLVDQEKMMKHLRFIADKEKIDVDDDGLRLIAEHGEGTFRDSINLLDQLANVNGGKIDAASVERSLGLASKKAIASLVDALLENNFASVNKQLTELENQGTNTASLIPQLTRYLQDLAPKHTQLYRLLDELIEVPRSYNPKLKLRTTLTKFALPAVQPVAPVAAKPMSSSSASPAVNHKTAPVAVAKPILNVEKPQPKPAPKKREAEEPQQATGSKLNGIDENQWGQILAQVKAESVPLHGILRQAQPDFDEPSQTLTLKFRYSLHQKRIDDAKSKKLIADTMLQLLGGAPIITTATDASAIAPEITVAAAPLVAEEKPKPAVDDVAKSVIDMMGGGEVVNA